ncbi:isopenicillin N synthase family oxygenase [Catenovulum sp. SM1970]|uniref:isopenicillin N synthase family oxygenase n=1 Tax=Marinifaba aquimaris TaxID=2741323 RepID=UPI001572EE90|nr:isopenicillin N synthase family oxygenase [Marinifaba aquimaris]
MNIQVVDFTAANAPECFVQSLKETGFAVLINHPLTSEQLTELYQSWQAFFDSDEKQQFIFDPAKQDGFFSTETSETAKGAKNKDLKEFYHYYPWGRAPQALASITQSYYQQASQLASTLLDWVEQYSPENIKQCYSQSLSSMIDSTPNTLLRVLHYPPLTGDEPEGAVRAAAHEDINLLTVLPAANEAGLQVKDKTGNWLDVPCDYGSLVINIGDMLQEASQGYFPSTSHRVINPEGKAAFKSRIALPLFLHPKSDVVLSDRHTQASYLLERLKELGLK